MHEDIVVLLTATVNVRGVSFMKRSDPQVRLKDYEQSLRLWLANPDSPTLIFCENSGYNLTPLMRIYKECNPYSKKAEFLSFDGNNYARDLGKGYGEIQTIDYALQHSKFIGSDTMVIKVTGRYYIANVASIQRGIWNGPKTEVYCNLQTNLTVADTRIFCASVSFLKKFLFAMQEIANDSQGIYIEHILARATHQCMAQGLGWSLLPCYPDIRGVSGTNDAIYSVSIFSRLKRNFIQGLKAAILAR